MSFLTITKPMPEIVYRSNIEKTLAIVKVGPDVYTNAERPYVPPGTRGVFGGTLVAQGLFAAIKTVPEGFVPHSLHSYFLAPSDNKDPLYYNVTRLRDGNKFIAREVKVYQRGVVIFIVTCSFTLKDLGDSKPKKSLKFSKPPPSDLPPYDQFLDASDSFKKAVAGVPKSSFKPHAQAIIHNFLRRFKEGPLDYKVTTDYWQSGREPGHPDFDKKAHEINVNLYVRVREPIKEELFNYVATAYYSDSYLLITTMKFHKRPLYSAYMSVSLDHTMYFHKPLNANEYSLYSVQHLTSNDNRTVLTGQIYNKDNELTTSIVQEGLVVLKDDVVKPKL